MISSAAFAHPNRLTAASYPAFPVPFFAFFAALREQSVSLPCSYRPLSVPSGTRLKRVVDLLPLQIEIQIEIEIEIEVGVGVGIGVGEYIS